MAIGTTLAFLSFFTFPAFADEVVFKPEGCEFAITFPEEPYTIRKCQPDNPEECSDFTSFTHVFGVDATVNIKVTCYPAESGMRERYSGDVMKVTLAGMVKDQNPETLQTDFQEFPFAKQAVALGTATEGNSDKIFAAQLWIGDKSVYTLQGEMIGAQLDEADEMFIGIMGSITHESNMKKKTEAPENKDEQADSPAEKDEE